MQFSLIIPCYNVAPVLPVTLPSYLEQTQVDAEYEVICVDDGSKDNTRSVLEQYREWEQLRIRYHLRNRGLAATRNTGIKRARGDLLLFIDGDVELAPDFLAQVKPWFDDESILGVMMITQPAPEVTMDKFQRFLYKRNEQYPKNDLFPVPYRRFLFNATVMRADVIEEIGLFDEHFRTYGVEDTEFAYRLYQRFGKGFFTSRTPLSWHHHHHHIEEFCESLYLCGRENVPYLQRIQPKLGRRFGTPYASLSKETGWRGLVGTVLLRPWLAKGAQALYTRTPFPLSNSFVRYLGLYHLVRGYRDWMQGQGSPGTSSSQKLPLKPGD